MDRPSRRPGCDRDRASDGRAHVPARVRHPIEQRQVTGPAHVAAEDPDLVDRLRRAPVPQLGRAVGGQHNERHPCERRLDDGRQEVGDRRPGRHDDRDRPTRGAGKTQREVPGGPLVEQHADPEKRMRARGEGEWRRARARADHDLGDAGLDELLGDRTQGEHVGHRSPPLIGRLRSSRRARSSSCAA